MHIISIYIFITVLSRCAQREEGQREARKIIGEKTEPYHSEAQLVQHHLDCTFNKHGAIYKGELFWRVYLSWPFKELKATIKTWIEFNLVSVSD